MLPIDPAPIAIAAELWLHPGVARWHMVTLPEEVSDRLRFDSGPGDRPWGYLHVEVTVGGTTWRTMAYPRKGTACFDLPIRIETRRREGIELGDTVTLTVRALPQMGGRLAR